MTALSVQKKSIVELLSPKSQKFLIPDYQRAYAWKLDECETLWEDLCSFAVPDENYERFKEDDQYFLGTIVTFTNDNKESEVIDGQQRLTSILLLLRVFYDKLSKMSDDPSKILRTEIEKCIWGANELGIKDQNTIKIKSEVATESSNQEFINILKDGEIQQTKFKKEESKYLANFRYFF